jgi:hypothetical protein
MVMRREHINTDKYEGLSTESFCNTGAYSSLKIQRLIAENKFCQKYLILKYEYFQNLVTKILNLPITVVALRHDMSSPAPIMWTRVRIPLEAWMYVCFHSMSMLFCVGSGLASGWSQVQGILPAVYRVKISELINSKWTQGKRPNQ